MAAKTIANLKVETEGDQQILYFTLSSVTDADTVSVASFFKTIREISLMPSTATAIGATHSAGVITIKVNSGTPNLICRIAGGA